MLRVTDTEEDIALGRLRPFGRSLSERRIAFIQSARQEFHHVLLHALPISRMSLLLVHPRTLVLSASPLLDGGHLLALSMRRR